MMNSSSDLKSGDDLSEISFQRRHIFLKKSPRSLQRQLERMRQEKMILLDQLAQFEVPVCFSCHKNIPMMEETLHDMKDRRLKRLRKVRETCVRASEDYETERERLLYLESELNIVSKKSEELKLTYEKEQLNIKVLNKEINDIKNEKDILADIKLKAKNQLNNLKLSVKNIKDENFFLDTKVDKEYIEKECETMKRQLKELKVERNELETELYSIAKYIKIKESELDNLKKNLNGVRQEEYILHESKDSAMKEQSNLKVQIEEIKNYNYSLKNEINNHESELTKDQRMLEEIKEAKEKIVKDQDKMRKELIDLGEGTKRLRHVLSDYKIQNKSCEDEILQSKEKLAASNIQIEDLKSKLYETAKQIEYLETHYRASQKLQEELRLKLVEQFTNSRSQLRQLREQNENINLEIDRFVSPILQEKKESIDKEKLNIIQTNRELAELKDTIRNKHEIITNLTTSFEILENEHKELKTKCESKKSKINELKAVKNRDMKVVEDLQQACEVLETICKRSALFTHHIQETMKRLLDEFDRSTDQLQNIELSAAQMSTDGNKSLKDFIDFLQRYFVTFIDEHCHELKENKERDLQVQIDEDTEKLKSLKEKRDYIKKDIDDNETVLVELSNEKKKLAEKIELKISSTEKLKTSFLNALNDFENTQRKLQEIKSRKKEIESEINEETKILGKLCEQRDDVVEESCKLETTSKLQATKLNELNAEIKKQQQDKSKKLSILQQLTQEIQQLQYDIDIQRKKRCQNINMHNQERHEILMETRNKKQIEKSSSSLQDLADKAREGVKNSYPLRSNVENPSNIGTSGSSSKANASLKNRRLTFSLSSDEISSDENVEELCILGKLRKK